MMLEQITRRLAERIALRDAMDRQAALAKREQAALARKEKSKVKLVTNTEPDVAIELPLEKTSQAPTLPVEVVPTASEPEGKVIVIGVRVPTALHERLGQVKNSNLAKQIYGKPTYQTMALEALKLGLPALREVAGGTEATPGKVVVVGVRVPTLLHERLTQVKNTRQGKPTYQALALEAMFLGIDALEAKYAVG